MTPPVLRLIADDPAGTVDRAAEFSGRRGPVPVVRRGPFPAGSLAMPTFARERGQAETAERTAALARPLAGADMAFLKTDRLRGGFRHAILAPAFPTWGRISRARRHWALGPRGIRQGSDDPLPQLLAVGRVPVPLGDYGAPLAEGVSVFDVATDDLERMAALGRA